MFCISEVDAEDVCWWCSLCRPLLAAGTSLMLLGRQRRGACGRMWCLAQCKNKSKRLITSSTFCVSNELSHCHYIGFCSERQVLAHFHSHHSATPLAVSDLKGESTPPLISVLAKHSDCQAALSSCGTELSQSHPGQQHQSMPVTSSAMYLHLWFSLLCLWY